MVMYKALNAVSPDIFVITAARVERPQEARETFLGFNVFLLLFKM